MCRQCTTGIILLFFLLYHPSSKYAIVRVVLYVPNIVPIDEAMLRPMAPPDRESKLALSAHAHALVPAK